ncbi:hypothetical protein B484DRAFT_452921 [Ochromonadaceae sp. CCMP2298]|nr:hypothetical protein B484DRAFT_452921 [Ochromonadaceae sp. CCMP2298]
MGTRIMIMLLLVLVSLSQLSAFSCAPRHRHSGSQSGQFSDIPRSTDSVGFLGSTGSVDSVGSMGVRLFARPKASASELSLGEEVEEVGLGEGEMGVVGVRQVGTVEAGGGEGGKCSQRCYFDKSNPCPLYERCPYDDRPCESDREYLDEIFGVGGLGLEEGNVMQIRIGRLRRMGRVYTELMGILGTISAGPDVGVMGDAEKMPNYKAQHQHPPTYRKMSPQARRVRRQRLFLMSTWLDDLLPDPHQGRSWMVNMLVDACKMSTRAASVVLSLAKAGNKPNIVQY